jgi:hypothetical protein
VTPAEILDAIARGEYPPPDVLEGLDAEDRHVVIEHLLQTDSGRAWLRRDPNLDENLANALLWYVDDFRHTRRDTSLTRVVARASHDAIVKHADAIASGSASASLWDRLSSDSPSLVGIASSIVSSSNMTAAESTLAHLVLDPMNAFNLTEIGARHGRHCRAPVV